MSNNTPNNNAGNNAGNNVSNDVEGALAELKGQYTELVAEIKTKHEEQQKMFEDMAKQEYDGEEYDADRINHLIEANVLNLKEQRDKIWQYLSETYDRNTRTTYRNFKQLKENEKRLERQKQRKLELANIVGDYKNQNNTQRKLIQHNRYQHKQIHNKAFMQFVLMVSLLSCILLLYLTTVDIVDPYVGWTGALVVSSITVLYYIYRTYIYRMNRDQHNWHKIYFRRAESPKQGNNNNNDLESVDYAKLDEEAKKVFDKYKDSCQSKDVVTLN